MNAPQKLQLFAEMASYCNVFNGNLRDPTNPENRQNAEKWLKDQLGFLSHQDRFELEEVWRSVVEEPRNNRLLFCEVRHLQRKYSDNIPLY